MRNLDVNKTADAWSSLAGTIFVPHTEEEYRRLVSLLVGVLIGKYEDEHVPELAVE